MPGWWVTVPRWFLGLVAKYQWWLRPTQAAAGFLGPRWWISDSARLRRTHTFAPEILFDSFLCGAPNQTHSYRLHPSPSLVLVLGTNPPFPRPSVGPRPRAFVRLGPFFNGDRLAAAMPTGAAPRGRWWNAGPGGICIGTPLGGKALGTPLIGTPPRSTHGTKCIHGTARICRSLTIFVWASSGSEH